MVVTGPVTYDADPDVGIILTQKELTPEVLAAAERVELRIGPMTFAERLGTAAEDTAAHWLVRLNALRLLADRGAIGELPAFTNAMKSRDERVRLAAVSGMREYMSVRAPAAIQILGIALKDSSPRVVTAALQVLADREVGLLRELNTRTTNGEIRKITTDLIRVAEERGAALVAADTAGTLRRTTATGTTVTFRPTKRYPDWDAAVGDVTVALPGGKPVALASGVEVVGSVVPVFITTDGKTAVYEIDRAIHARNLETGETRKLADGIAPRLLPFTNDVIYFVEDVKRRSMTANSVGHRYEIRQIPVAGGEAKSVGEVGANSQNAVKGNYSPLRWSRIEEQEGAFYLVGETIAPVRLPSPFGN